MAHGINIKTVIKATLGKILGLAISLILCLDLKSLYDYLVKLGTTQEKQLIVDVMSLCQSYKQQEITKVKWIYRYHNPADSMTIAKLSPALKILINLNCTNIYITEWVQRVNMKPMSTKQVSIGI